MPQQACIIFACHYPQCKEVEENMFGIRGNTSKQGAGDPGAWTVYDRIEEVKGKLTLKRRDKEAYYTFSQQKISENEGLIAELRAEIKDKQIQQKRSLNADEHVIREGFKKNRESQLAMQRYTVGKAITEKNEHVFDKVKQLNMARHEKSRRKRKIEQLLLTLRDLKCAARTGNENESSQRVRVLTTSIDKMKMKCGSARFIQKTYKQILFHLERDSLTLPGRLHQLESSLQGVKNELNNELLKIQSDAKNAFDQTKVEKEQLDSRILKLKRARDSTLAQTRKKFKKLSQEGQEKESRPRKRHTNKGAGDNPDMLRRRETKGRQFWEQVRSFWITKKTMDQLRDHMCVGEPAYIADSFRRQIERNTELKKMVEVLSQRKKSLSETLVEITDQLAKVKQGHQEMLDETRTQAQQLQGNRVEKINKMSEAADRLRNVQRIVFKVASSVDGIRHKVAKCDWIAKEANQQAKMNLEILMGNTAPLEKLNPFVQTLDTFLLTGEKIHALHVWVEKNKVAAEDPEQFNEILRSDNSQEMLVALASSSPNNTRIVIDDEEDILPAEDFLCDDDDTNDEYLSRDVIKSAMEKMSDSANVRKRRKRQKK